MMYRRLGLDNCNSCDESTKVGRERYCKILKIFLAKSETDIIFKPKQCNKPYKFDLTDDNQDLIS